MTDDNNQMKPELAVCDHCAPYGRCQLAIPALYELPRKGQKCQYTHKSRSWWEERIYPNLRNKGVPPIQVPRPQGSGSKSKPIIPGVLICAYLRALGCIGLQK